MLTTEQWQRVKNLFAEALEKPADERRAFLERSCADCAQMLAEALSLLEHHRESENFLNRPVVQLLEEPIPTLQPGDNLGPYRVVGKLGQGGMGSVYLAERADAQYSKQVAIKVLRAELGTETLVRRFRLERQILADLDHPNIAHLIDGGTTAGGLPYLVMDYIDGEPIDRYCERRRLAVRARLELFLGVCGAVSYAHQRRIVHRDLKPGNILVTAEGMPRLLDFGVAKLLEHAESIAPEASLTVGTEQPAGVTGGALTPEYAAPEQLHGGAITPITDIYALGVVLYELLHGSRPPRPGPEPAARPQSSQLEELDSIACKAMSVEPEGRYPSVDAFAADIRNYLDGRPVTARGVSWLYGARKFLGRHRVSTALAAAALALASGYGWSLLEERLLAASGKTVVVLPFSERGSTGDERLADGLTLSLTTHLGKVAALTVISDRAAMQYRDSSLAQIGGDLGATGVLTGSVLRSGERVRIAARLVDPRSGTQLWAEQYDRKLQDIFAIQTEVAQRIAAAMKAKLTPEEKIRLARAPAQNAMAYQYYLRGREYNNRFTVKDNEYAIGFFKQALALDPDFALARSGLAVGYLNRFIYGGKVSWREAACREAGRAVALESGLAEAHNAMAACYSQMELRLQPQAMAEYRRAIDLNPNFFSAMYNYSAILASLGRLDEGLYWMKKAVRVNPLCIGCYRSIASYYWLLGEAAKGDVWIDKGLALIPDGARLHVSRGRAYLPRGRYDEARQIALQVLKEEPNNAEALSLAGTAERLSGRWERSRRYYERMLKLTETTDLEDAGDTSLRARTALGYLALQENQPQRAHRLLAQSLDFDRKRIAEGNEEWLYFRDMAVIHALGGEREAAVVQLREAIKNGYRDVHTLQFDPIFENLRRDKRFEQLLTDLRAQIEKMRLRALAQEL
ncbi:serine/threonine-protein kinase [Gloeobacter violaceus]|uniref:Serine/threonine protein kinase n=1 Tax=Gloeobacter violaceus (strain ATCC 29082 / PCC 7421) TaxID=251221 RepID=Q7NLM6_GLOVI|nr:serine/threonine-protein kinase [Gloeobacter violaceus]BAC89037.1 serine/threonine protein kinase [Gloeobacter violaceus PCC 7421]